MRWILRLNLVIDGFKFASTCVLSLQFSNYFDFCCFRAMTVAFTLGCKMASFYH